jgi:tetratricopeptide (TPR) repeat protein
MKFEKIINLIRQNNLIDAKKLLKNYVKKDPTDVKGINLLGILLLKENNLIDGIQYLKKSLLIKKNQLDVIKNLISAYQSINQYEEAIQLLEENLNIHDEELIFKLGYFYNRENYFEKAIHEYKKLINSNFDQSVLFYNLAISYENYKKIFDAIECYQTALRYDENNKKVKFNLAALYLYSNNFKLGWKFFESRLSFEENLQKYTSKNLQSINCTNKNILLIFEQGIGDHILFSTFLASLDLNTNTFYLKLDTRLHGFIKRKYQNVNLYEDKHLNLIDYHIYVGSLGSALRSDLQSFEGIDYYWDTDINLQQEIKNILPNKKNIIGISWASQNKFTGKFKEINIKEIIKGINIDNVLFVNLQYGDVQEKLDEIKNDIGVDVLNINFDKFNDIEKLAALIKCCNFIITTSNVTAHLAGVLDIKSFVIPPKIHGKLWYWGNKNKNRSLWYKSVTILENDLDDDHTSHLRQINQLIELA